MTGTAATALQPGAVVAGHRLLRLLGSGAQSRVFLAEAPPDGHPVALKLSRLPAGTVAAAAAAQALQASATAAAALPPHPGIAAVWASGVAAPWAWVAMEPAPGVGLDRHVGPARLLPEPVVLQLGERIARALAHAHRHGLVHRDLKPANVLVHWGLDSVRLIDFGLARPTDAAHSNTGVLLGTPAYMAPEQLVGAVPDARADLYALGVMLFELLTGSRPYDGGSMGELLQRVGSSQPPAALRALRPELPAGPTEAVQALLLQLLSRQPQDRPADADAVAAALHALAAQWPRPPGARLPAAGGAPQPPAG